MAKSDRHPSSSLRPASQRFDSKPTRVLIADDHSVVRDGLVALIRQEPDLTVIADTGNGRDAVELWKAHKPDVTLMDLRMPGLDGVDAIKEIRAVAGKRWSSALRPACAV